MDEEIDVTDSSHASNADSARDARARIADSSKIACAHVADSTKTARKEKADSVQAARKHITDSTAAVRRYRESKHYKDSVAHVRLARTNALKNQRQTHTDSVKNSRKTLTDSLATVRKTKTDSIRTIQKRRSDSIAVIRKYKLSKRYADSVSIVRHDRMDSMHNAQKTFRDSVAAVRKHSLDSSKTSRKHVMDSVKTVRTKFTDSIKLVRKVKTDSLAKVKAEKEKIAKAKEKKKEDAMKLKLELKMKQKHEAWTNKSMLKKKWKGVRRVAQNSFTHYNYYYNANKKMDEALVNMQRSRKENYDSLIGLYPFDPNRDSALLSADMDSIVHKASVAIQIHDPRVKWSNDMYLLLGEAYYYKGKYENASIAFRYIISADEAAKKKEAAKNGYGASRSKDAPSILEEEKKSRLDFLKHKSVHNEAILWLARTYTESKQAENAESIMSLLESDTKLPDHLKGRLAIEKAFAYLEEKNDVAASTQLAIAVNDNNLPTWLRMRASFLNGQLLQNKGDYTAAAKSFTRVLDFFPKIEMDFYTRKYIAYNTLLSGQDVAEAMKPLKKVLNDGKYVSYYDQVYYVLGKLAAKAGKNDEAITYLSKSTTTPKATKKQKSISFVALGDVYYSTASYSNAKNSYDSAAKYGGGTKDSAMVIAHARSKGLAEVLGPAKVIHDQDSLLALAALSKKEQLAVVRRYLRYLEQKMDDSISAADNAGVASLTPADEVEISDASNWYFSNPSQIQQGTADFKRKWGTRPLTDNWRRAAANTFTNNSKQDDDDDGVSKKQENGLPSEESLMAKIPNTPQQKELAAKVEQRAYMLLANAYVKQLEDYPQATSTLDTLDKRYVDNTQKEEELYLRYQIAIKQNNLDKAQAYSEELLTKFPHSEYAGALKPKHSESKAPASTGPVAAYFDETYSLLMQHQYTEALTRINVAKGQYDDPVYKKRFEVAEAMAYAGMGNYNKGDSVITGFMRAHPGDSLIAWAGSVQDYIKEVRNGGMPSWYKDWPPKDDLGKPIVKKEKPAPKYVPPPVSDVPYIYSYHADSAHYCIIVLPGLDSRTAALKQGIRKFDSSKFDTANLDLLLDLFNTQQSVLEVKKFANATEAKSYMDSLITSSVFHDYRPDEYQVYIIAADNYKKMFADKKAQPYAGFYSSHYK